MSFGRNLLVMGVVLFVVDWLLSNVSLGYSTGSFFSFSDFVTHLPVFLVSALVLAILTSLSRLGLQWLHLPINFVTLGILNIVANVFILTLAAHLVDGFEVAALNLGGWQLGVVSSYLLVAVIFGLVEVLLGLMF